MFSLPGGPGGFTRVNLQKFWRTTPFCRVLVALLLAVLLEGAHEGSLVLGGLEPSVAELGAGVDELEVDLLKSPLLGVGEKRLPQGKSSLLGPNAATLDTIGSAFDFMHFMFSQVLVGFSVVTIVAFPTVL